MWIWGLKTNHLSTIVFFFQTVIIVLQAAKAGKASERAKGPKAWIREGTEEEPVDFLDPGVVQRVVGEFCYFQVAL